MRPARSSHRSLRAACDLLRWWCDGRSWWPTAREADLKRFVVVVDTQWDFMAVDGALSVDGAEALVEPMRHWLKSLSTEDTDGVLFTFDTHTPEIYRNSEEAKSFPIHCIRGSMGWENMLSAEVVPSAIPAWRLEKGVFDMWEETHVVLSNAREADACSIEREAFFAELKSSGITTVTVIGVAADYCVRWAVDGLIARGFDVEVPAALTRGIDRQFDQVLTEDFAAAAVTLV